MAVEKYFSQARDQKSDPSAAKVKIVTMDGGFFKGSMFLDTDWLTAPHSRDDMFSHSSDELLAFIGSDPQNPEDLGAEIELWLENDKLTLTHTCFVFVPKGTAHGRFSMKNVRRPVFRSIWHTGTDTYAERPAAPTKPAGTFAGNVVERYAPVDGKLPTAPEGFLTLLLWIDGKKLPGAPYMEDVWFHTVNDTGPEAHSHAFDELVAFIGSDPENPGDLGGEVTFCVEDEPFSVTKSCLVYVPRGVRHSPIFVPRLERPILHFSGGNGGDYIREGSDQF